MLEWRFDPASGARLPQATGYDVKVIVICSEGYTSSLAAAALRDLGLTLRHGRRRRFPCLVGSGSPDDDRLYGWPTVEAHQGLKSPDKSHLGIALSRQNRLT